MRKTNKMERFAFYPIPPRPEGRGFSGLPVSMSYRPSTDKAAIVAPGFYWIPIGKDTPRGCKLQLINKNAGVATYGILDTDEHFWTHWAPLPVFDEKELT